MKWVLTLGCFVILYGCSQGGGNIRGGGNIQEAEAALDQVFAEKNCSQEVIQSGKNRVEKLKQLYSEREVVRKINLIIMKVQKIGC